MRVAVWHDPQHGPAFVAVAPGSKDQYPDTACIPYYIPRAPASQLHAKGEKPGWGEWFTHLTGRLPYHGGQWSVQEVPDGLSARQVLAHVREKAVEQGLGVQELCGASIAGITMTRITTARAGTRPAVSSGSSAGCWRPWSCFPGQALRRQTSCTPG